VGISGVVIEERPCLRVEDPCNLVGGFVQKLHACQKLQACCTAARR